MLKQIKKFIAQEKVVRSNKKNIEILFKYFDKVAGDNSKLNLGVDSIQASLSRVEVLLKKLLEIDCPHPPEMLENIEENGIPYVRCSSEKCGRKWTKGTVLSP